MRLIRRSHAPGKIQAGLLPSLLLLEVRRGLRRQTRHETAVHGFAVTGAGRCRSRAESEPEEGEMKLVVI